MKLVSALFPKKWQYSSKCRCFTPFPQTSMGPSGLPGKLVVLESRTELDCLIEFINDQFDNPTKLRWYALNLGNFFVGRIWKKSSTLKVYYQQVCNGAEGEDDSKQGDLQVGRSQQYQRRLWRSHSLMVKLVTFCSSKTIINQSVDFSRKGGSIPATASAPCVYMEIGQTSAVNGLWSLANCNVVTMLAICEFE